MQAFGIGYTVYREHERGTKCQVAVIFCHCKIAMQFKQIIILCKMQTNMNTHEYEIHRFICHTIYRSEWSKLNFSFIIRFIIRWSLIFGVYLRKWDIPEYKKQFIAWTASEWLHNMDYILNNCVNCELYVYNVMVLSSVGIKPFNDLIIFHIFFVSFDIEIDCLLPKLQFTIFSL